MKHCKNLVHVFSGCWLNLLFLLQTFLARKQPGLYQQVGSTTGVIFIRGFGSMKIQRII